MQDKNKEDAAKKDVEKAEKAAKAEQLKDEIVAKAKEDAAKKDVEKVFIVKRSFHDDREYKIGEPLSSVKEEWVKLGLV